MLLNNPLFFYGIKVAWFLHAISSYILKKKFNFFHAYYQGTWSILGFIGLLILAIQIGQFVNQILSGVIYEQWAFWIRILGNAFLWIIMLNFLLPILFCLNLFKKYKNSKILRRFQMIVIFVIIFTGLLITEDFATSIIPGWHTTIYATNLPFIIITSGVIILLLNLIFFNSKRSINYK